MTQEPDFRLGPLAVRPISNEIAVLGGVEALEPRVMQVLVELAQRRGEVVSRDALVERCWFGRAVSEDAIQRCIARLRRIGEAHGGYSIDTIRGVGYRLTEIGGSDVTRPSLAVLAFDNLSSDTDLDYFCDGVSEEILHAASRAAPLKVIGRASSFRFRGPDKIVAKVAALLNVSHILDGSVRRNGNRVRISVRLVEAATEQIIWADRFDRNLSDSFAIQDEIARAVTAALGAALPPAEPLPAIDPFAYDLYQRGRELGISFGIPGAIRRAISLLEESVARAPLLAPAWALLAQSQVQYRAREAPQRDVESFRVAVIESVKRALALDPQNGGALACLAFVEAPAGAFEKQEKILERAMATANAIGVLAPFSTFCASVGRNREALSLVEMAWQRDPLHPGIANWRAILLWQNGLIAESIAAIERILAAGDIAGTLLGHAATLSAYEGNWEFVDRLLSHDPSSREAGDDPGMQLALATISVLRSPNDENRARVLAKARNDLASTGTVSLGVLCFLAYLGLVDEAHELAERSSFHHLTDAESRFQLADVGLHFLFSRPSRPLRQDRRFVRLCAKLGLVDYWTKTGRWPDCVDEIAPHYDFIAECEAKAGSGAPRE
ncbi:MAG: winged helix-turn-helix domain-containing protein [Rhizomicrobium sp.]|jgi:TolB-like protein